MSEAVLVSGGTFRLVPRESGAAAFSQSESPPDELTLALERCRLLAEREQALQQELAREQAQRQALRAAFDKNMEAYSAEMERAALRELTSLSIRVAELIIRRELPDREMIRDVVQRTLAPLTDLRGTRVRMHPADATLLENSQGTGHGLDSAGRIEIVPDPTLAPGDITMETPVGFFDARIAQRLKLVEAQIMERAATATPHPAMPAATPGSREDAHAQPH
jgi:flagellar biosynthesis/type III secretory pathway protein FliH